MRATNIGGKEIQLRANPLALLFYRQEFGRDLVADAIAMQQLQSMQEGDFSGLNTITFFQIAWAMNKAAKPSADFPGFEDWLGQFDSVGLGDAQWLIDVIEEAADGFFRSGGAAPKAKPKK